jgi:nucleolar protein 56
MSTLNELDPVLNRLAKKMREWYALYSPEFEKSVSNNDAFIRLIVEKDRDALLKELGVEQTMGGDISRHDKEFLKRTAGDISTLFERREKIIEYIKEIAQDIMPNTVAITGAVMASRMLAIAGSLERMSKYPSSTIQLLGAENALFKHLRTGSKCPKYGFLINHPLVTKTQKKFKGKTARAIADKVAIAVKVDYFKGEPIGEKLRQQLEKRFG